MHIAIYRNGVRLRATMQEDRVLVYMYLKPTQL